MNLFIKIIFVLFSFCNPLQAGSAISFLESENMRINLQLVAEGLGIPWGMSFIADDQLLVTERDGAVRLLDTASGKYHQLKNIPDVLAQGQGGMLDVAVSPDYKKDGWIYFTYVKDVDIDSDGVTVLARARLVGDTFEDWQELLVTKSATDKSYHFGSRITFDNDGHVFFGVGDRGVRDNAQDLTNHAGTIMRLNRDGSVPADNPFSRNKAFLPEVWSVGHRNPQGLVFDADNNRLWEIEHGPRGGDEINLIKAGANYGWPVISYGKEYWGPFDVGEGTHRDGMEQPKKVYTPSIAPGSLLLYTGDELPAWKGNLFSGALKLQHINRIVLSKGGEVIKEERLLEDLGERIRALTQSPQGWIYFSTDSGKIFRMRALNSLE
jgi:glucose/arabinose dehydrogenase